MKVLVLNCGSSSLKFRVIAPAAGDGPFKEDSHLAHGLVERIGHEATGLFEARGASPYRPARPIRNHEEAVREVIDWLRSLRTAKVGALDEIDAVGHRVVHGGESFDRPVLIDDRIVGDLESFEHLAPLHNPACVSGIRAARKVFGARIPMVAVFDTSFHRSLPDYARTYAIPLELAERHGIRRYGFHGLAHRYSALRYAEISGMPGDRVNIVTLHLGNGCSACAIRRGRSVDTSMGFTPLEGLVMATRSGDLDAGVLSFLASNEGMTPEEIDSLLNRESGLVGLSGRGGDMRELAGLYAIDARARLAIDIFCYRARKYIGAYLAALDGAQAVVFSGGIGENSYFIRAKICASMEWCGLEIDDRRNRAAVGSEGQISADNAALRAYVVATDEEALIARDTAGLVENKKRRRPKKTAGQTRRIR